MEKYIKFIRAIVKFVDKCMDFGGAGCPFCGHHHNHDADCLYLEARHLLIDA